MCTAQICLFKYLCLCYFMPRITWETTKIINFCRFSSHLLALGMEDFVVLWVWGFCGDSHRFVNICGSGMGIGIEVQSPTAALTVKQDTHTHIQQSDCSTWTTVGRNYRRTIGQFVPWSGGCIHDVVVCSVDCDLVTKTAPWWRWPMNELSSFVWHKSSTDAGRQAGTERLQPLRRMNAGGRWPSVAVVNRHRASTASAGANQFSDDDRSAAVRHHPCHKQRSILRSCGDWAY